MSVLAIITARGGSKRIPRKNIKNFCGKPIITYSIDAALKSNIFDEIMVSTDDVEIAELSRTLGANIPFVRSDKTSDDFSSTADVLTEVIEEYSKIGKTFDYICCIYPTAPFINGSKLQESFEKFKKTGCDALIPIVAFDFPIQRALKIDNDKLEVVNPEFTFTRSQDLETMYHDAGQFYWLKTEELLNQKTLFMKDTTFFILPENEVRDIDTQNDWEIAEVLYREFLNE